jgi:predicted molibdopterin-dependent oxidoreductase YjgC
LSPMSVKMLIDGREVAFEGKKTVLEVARDNGFYIPSLCWHKKIGPASMCRVCVVEIDGMRGLQTACSVEAAEGMKVTTDSPSIKEARKLVVNLLLANGQHNCLSCEANGECELQDAAYHLGIEVPAFTIAADADYPKDESSEMIARHSGKCIQCGRCIKGCNNTVVNEVLDFGYRADKTKVICDDDQPMGDSSCVQCGECSQLCPVGAIIDKKAIGLGRPWELKKVDTVCTYCGVGCQLTLHVDERTNKIVKISGVDGAATSDGMLCVKGRYGYEFVNSPERLTTPLIKNPDGSFRRATWEEALDLIATKFKAIKTKHGSDALAGLASAKVTNEENFVFQKFFRKEVGTNNVDHCARL